MEECRAAASDAQQKCNAAERSAGGKITQWPPLVMGGFVSAFASCLGFTLPEEGGFSDTPGDPGGPTEQGITLASWRAYVASPWVQVAELRSISAGAVNAFYGAMYWNPIMGDAPPARRRP